MTTATARGNCPVTPEQTLRALCPCELSHPAQSKYSAF